MCQALCQRFLSHSIYSPEMAITNPPLQVKNLRLGSNDTSDQGWDGCSDLSVSEVCVLIMGFPTAQTGKAGGEGRPNEGDLGKNRNRKSGKKRGEKAAGQLRKALAGGRTILRQDC